MTIMASEIQLTFADIFCGITPEYISKALGSGTGFSGGKVRVSEFFAKEKDREKRAQFLKDEYGIGGWAYCDDDGIRHHLNHDARGLELLRGEEERFFRWPEIADRIGKMIDEGSYL